MEINNTILDENRCDHCFDNHYSYSVGGGLIAFSIKYFTANNITIQNCAADNGGGMYIDNIDSMILD